VTWAGQYYDVEREVAMDIKQVDVKQAYLLQHSEGYTYLDVRSIPEYEKGHPAGAFNVPLLHFDPATGQMRPNPEFLSVMQANYPLDAKLLIGCQVGGRSSQAAEILASVDYSDVSNVLGGFGGARNPATGQYLAEGWTQAGLPVENDTPPGAGYEDLKKTSGS
jgi:rhodanese-related sulfurtransferase